MLLLEHELIDQNCEVREDVLRAQVEFRNQLNVQLEQMMQRYQQLTNPNENQDQVLIQNLLSNLVGKEDHELLLNNLNQSAAAQEETVRLLDRQLNEMGFDADEVKQTQPRFFEMIVLCYQANIAKL